MKSFLPLLCLALLPLPASALLENATVSAEATAPNTTAKAGTLQRASYGGLAPHEGMTAELKTLLEAQLEKMPNLSGIYVGIIRGHTRQASTGGGEVEPQVEFFRITPVSEGENHLWIADEQGAFKMEMILKPAGRHWSLEGLLEYRTYADPQRVDSINASLTALEELTIIGGLSSEALRAMVKGGNPPVADDPQQMQRVNRLTGFFLLHTAADPLDSPNNPIHRVQLPSGRTAWLKPGLSPDAARVAIAELFADDAPAGAAATVADEPALRGKTVVSGANATD